VGGVAPDAGVRPTRQGQADYGGTLRAALTRQPDARAGFGPSLVTEARRTRRRQRVNVNAAVETYVRRPDPSLS